MTPIRVVQLVDILILRIENGKDYFLTVSAEFGPTPQGKLFYLSNLFN